MQERRFEDLYSPKGILFPWGHFSSMASDSWFTPMTIRRTIIHGFLSGTEVILTLHLDGSVALTDREDAIRPTGAKRSQVSKVLKTAALHFDELAGLWEEIHGKA